MVKIEVSVEEREIVPISATFDAKTNGVARDFLVDFYAAKHAKSWTMVQIERARDTLRKNRQKLAIFDREVLITEANIRTSQPFDIYEAKKTTIQKLAYCTTNQREVGLSQM